MDYPELKDIEIGDLTKSGKEKIITQLVTTYSDDLDFLRKVNKITFGLISGS